MQWLEEITTNITFLTPNRRLTAYYLSQYQTLQQQKNQSCWQTLDILPFTSWIERCWKMYTQQTIAAQPLLLSSQQALLLWEIILSDSENHQQLLQLAKTAEIALSAWGLLKQWNLNLDHPSLTLTDDSHAFLSWATAFEKRCQTSNWVDPYSLPDLLIEKIELGEILLSEKIILIGFTEIVPQYQKLLDACKKHGTEVHHYSHENQGTYVKISAQDNESEVRTMAQWAKTLYLSSPHQRIGCIIPNLEDQRDMVSRIFTEVFTEEGLYSLDNLHLPFNITAGKSLINYPVIHIAFKLLELNNKDITLDTLSSLLRSPFLGDAETECLQRAKFEIELREKNITAISLKALIKQSHYLPLFNQHLKNFFSRLQQLLKKAKIDEWGHTFSELLTLLGWPGERSVNSEEYQVIQRWLKLLTEYLSYTNILPSITYQTALHYFKQLTVNTVFQIESPQTSIQVLGILEAAEIPFDHLWVMGMNDNQWPPAPKPNPFIPLSLQKSLNMPHATPERELLFCETLLSQLKNSAKYILFSYALHDNDAELRPSALIDDVPEISSEQLNLMSFQSAAELSFQQQMIETLSDEIAPPINHVDTIKGGTKIFEYQAACPFKAFAELRLHAKPVQETALGLRASDRGNIIHNILEAIWRELQDSETLSSKTTEELDALIHSMTQNTLQKIIPPAKHNTHYLQLETKRLQKIITHWLMLEKIRPAFRVISQEQTYQITIANISLSLRIDRIDEIADGEKLIIDYKTGKYNQIGDWFGERPDAPQLPLYCILDPEHTIGIAFAKLHSEKMELCGVSKYQLDTGSIKPIDKISWQQQLMDWKITLEKLGQDFCQGKAHIDPKNGAQTCEHCQLMSLCRVYEGNYANR